MPSKDDWCRNRVCIGWSVNQGLTRNTIYREDAARRRIRRSCAGYTDEAENKKEPWGKGEIARQVHNRETKGLLGRCKFREGVVG